MKYFKLSLVTLAILISGCGGGGSNGSTPAANTNDAKTVGEAEKNYNALSTFQAIDLSLNAVSDTSSKILNKVMSTKISNQKTTTANCSNGGTIVTTFSDDEKTINYAYNNCKEGTSFIDGEITMGNINSETVKFIYNKLTMKDVDGTQYMHLTVQINSDKSNEITTASMNGIVNHTSKSGEKNNMKFTNFVSKFKDTDASNESWATLDGTIAVESKCTTGTYQFETIEKLVDATDGSDNTESGILKLNGATYTFENPYVTIKVGGKEETIKQSELEKRMTTACTI